MSYLRFILRRAAFAVASIYLVVSATFFLGTLTVRNEIRNAVAEAEWPPTRVIPWEVEELRQGLIAAYDIRVPLHERYLGWLVDVSTLDWGRSITTNEPIVAILDGRVVTTLEYVIPGVVLAMLLGVGFGLVAALTKDGILDWSLRIGSYLFLGIPVFMLLTYLVYLAGWQIRLVGNWVVVLAAPGPKTLAAMAVGLGLLAGQLRFARASALEQTGQTFVKMLRAKGVNRLRLAQHVLRNAAIPIVSLSIAELLSVLVLNIYVIEEVLGIRGLAGASLLAAKQTDVPLLIWSTLVVVLLGISLNFVQDVLHGYLDPRLRTG